jgi:hypothetical protein
MDVLIGVDEQQSIDRNNPTTKDDVAADFENQESGILNILEEWDEPFQSGATENVSTN